MVVHDCYFRSTWRRKVLGKLVLFGNVCKVDSINALLSHKKLGNPYFLEICRANGDN